MPLGTGDVFAGYTVVRILGSGGMGEVYLVKHPRLPRQDALKVLSASISNDAEFRTRFEREADLAATLWHPHIVGVHDRGEFEGRLWIAMDYVEGNDAAKLLREQFPEGMPAEDVIEVASAIAGALDHAHDQQLLHRDVKPANILITDAAGPKRRILLADFGIARYADDTTGLTAANLTVGSVNYSAPEQLTGEQIDGRADQYSLAATTYHLLTGSPPFAHSNSAVVISGHLSKPPPRVAEAHPELARLDAVLAKAMSKIPAERYTSCTEFADALQTQSGAAGTTAVRPVIGGAEPVIDDDATQHIPTAPTPPSHTDLAPPPVTISGWGTPENTPPIPQNTPWRPGLAPAPQNAGGSGLSPKWVAAIGAVVAIVIAVGLLVVDMGMDNESSTTNTTATTAQACNPLTDSCTGDARSTTPTGTTRPARTTRPTRPTRTSASPVSIRPPGLIQTPDAYQESCGDGYSLSGEGGWATHGGRGSTQTSCYFAYSVLNAYWARYPTASRQPRQVVAEGTVPCNPSNAKCVGDAYVMDCGAIGSDPWITCTGGSNARVYLF